MVAATNLLFAATIGGEPRGKASVRVGHGRGHRDPVTAAYMGKSIRMLAKLWSKGQREREAIREPVELAIVTYRSRPDELIPNLSGRARVAQPPLESFGCPVTPDWDNIGKMIGDCLVKAGVLADDNLITKGSVEKRYVEMDGEPGVVIEIRATGDVWAAFALGADRPGVLDGGAEVGDDEEGSDV